MLPYLLINDSINSLLAVLKYLKLPNNFNERPETYIETKNNFNFRKFDLTYNNYINKFLKVVKKSKKKTTKYVLTKYDNKQPLTTNNFFYYQGIQRFFALYLHLKSKYINRNGWIAPSVLVDLDSLVQIMDDGSLVFKNVVLTEKYYTKKHMYNSLFIDVEKSKKIVFDTIQYYLKHNPHGVMFRINNQILHSEGMELKEYHSFFVYLTKKLIYYIEPEMNENHAAGDTMINGLLDVLNLKNIKIKQELNPKYGLQINEQRNLFPSDIQGYCLTWSAAVIDHILLNPTIKPQNIIKHLSEYINKYYKTNPEYAREYGLYVCRIFYQTLLKAQKYKLNNLYDLMNYKDVFKLIWPNIVFEVHHEF